MRSAPVVCSPSRFLLFALPLLLTQGGGAQGTPPAKGPSIVERSGDAPSLDAAREALSTTDYASAEPILKALRGKDEVAAKLLLARLYVETGRSKLALTEANAAIALGRRTEGSLEKAKALYAIGDTKAAVQVLEPFRKDTSSSARPLRLLLGEYLIATGHRGDAEEPLMTLPADYNNDAIDEKDSDGMAMVGRAAHLLRVPKDAHQAYKESIRANKLNLDAKRWWAELYFDKYDTGHAEEHVREILKIAPNHADTLALMAAIKLEQSFDFDAAEALLTKALSVNPVHGRALSMRAGLRLRDLDTGSADAIVDEGLRANPNDLSLLAMKAVIRFLADDMRGFADAKKELFVRNAEYADFYLTFGTYAEWEHRYEDLVTSMKEAVKMDPENGKLWAELGLWQLRAGEEEEGLKALNKGFSKDKFNVRAYNTLNLYDKQIKFDYVTVDKFATADNAVNASQVAAGGGATVSPIRVRLQKDERAMLERYVPRLLSEAFASMKTRYNFVPKLPVQVEIYNSREQFSVRTHGLPNIGIQGVCFGNMIAAISPSAEPFNWGNVLWHELGHVFAIQMSKNHVPRWFTEGLSEYETIARRPEWQREMDRDLFLALRRGSLPKLEDMNKAFTHVESVDDVAVAYYASSQLVVFLVERFGMPKVVDALRLWGKGETSPMVLQHAFGVPASDLDRSFRAWAEKRLSRYASQFVFDERARPLAVEKAEVEKNPKSAAARVSYAIALLRARNLEEAKKEVQQAFAIDPKNVEAHFLSSKWAKDPTEKKSHLKAVIEAGGDGYDARMALAVLAKKEKDLPSVRSLLEEAHRFDPGQPEPIRHLLELLGDEKLPPAQHAKRELALVSALANLEQHDGKTWERWLELLIETGRVDDAVKVGEGAVLVDVFNTKIHALFSDALEKQGNVAGARWEAESALLGDLEPAIAKRMLQRISRTAGTRQERESAEKKIRALEATQAPSPTK